MEMNIHLDELDAKIHVGARKDFFFKHGRNTALFPPERKLISKKM